MSQFLEVVNLVEEKLLNLFENYNFLREENELLYSKIATLESQIAEEKQLKSVLNQKYQTLKIAKTIAGSEGNRRETKLKINALIREVDVCINQLNE